MDKKQYLNRLNAVKMQASVENLSILQQAHLQKVPFENLDVIRSVPIYLNLQTIYQKIVQQHRGGFCYELNGLFHALLLSLGYEAHLISATVRKPNGEWAKANTHAAILVYLDQPYLVDVGFGAATPRVPVPLNGTVETPIGEIYTTAQQTDQMFDLILQTKKQTRILYRFDTTSKKLIDFHEGCVYNQISKESTFTHTDIISLATENGRITLQDYTLTKVVKGNVNTTILSAEEKEQALENIFSLSLK